MSKEITQEFQQVLPELSKHLEQLKKIVETSGEKLEGNCFYYHQTITPFPELLPKQLNLFWAGKGANKICEIGFNAGHSALLFLLANQHKSPFTFTVFDIVEHSYTKPTFEYLLYSQPHGTMELFEGDSTVTLPEWISLNEDEKGTYDLVHVDGGHLEHVIKSDMKYADILVKPGGIIIIDDTNVPFINNEVELYLLTGKYSELDIFPTVGYEHRILRKQNA